MMDPVPNVEGKVVSFVIVVTSLNVRYVLPHIICLPLELAHSIILLSLNLVLSFGS
jgi:hypothetical protein